MTLNLPESEMRSLEQIAETKGLSKRAVLRQALRLYQLVDIRQQEGHTMYFRGMEHGKAKEFVEIVL